MRTTPNSTVNIAELIPELASRSIVATRLHPRPGSETAMDISKMGGSFIWPQSEEWPFCDEHKTHFSTVLQLKSQDIPGNRFPANRDLLQILWCPNDHESSGYAPAVKAFWRRHQDIAESSSLSGNIIRGMDEYQPKFCTLHPEPVLEFPSPYELSEELIKKISACPELRRAAQDLRRETKTEWDASYAYQCLWSVAVGTKVGGYVHWVQDAAIPKCSACGNSMAHVLTIASAEFDGATRDRRCPIEDRECWQADYETRKSAQRASGLMLGDMGYVYIFTCNRCDVGAVQSVLQCS